MGIIVPNNEQRQCKRPSVEAIIARTHDKTGALIDGLTLSEKDRRACYLLFYGYSREEIAKDMGVSVMSTESRISRAVGRSRARDMMDLVGRYVREYLGVGEPWDEKPLPARERAKGAGA